MTNQVIMSANEANSIFKKAFVENKIDENPPIEFNECMSDVNSQIKHAAQMGRDFVSVFIPQKQCRPFVRIALIELGYKVQELRYTGYLEIKF